MNGMLSSSHLSSCLQIQQVFFFKKLELKVEFNICLTELLCGCIHAHVYRNSENSVTARGIRKRKTRGKNTESVPDL